MGLLKKEADSQLREAIRGGKNIRVKVNEKDTTVFDREQYPGVRRFTLGPIVEGGRSEVCATLEYESGDVVNDEAVELQYIEDALKRGIISIVTTFPRRTD